jgi:hypothetical protein
MSSPFVVPVALSGRAQPGAAISNKRFWEIDT